MSMYKISNVLNNLVMSCIYHKDGILGGLIMHHIVIHQFNDYCAYLEINQNKFYQGIE